MAEVSPTSSDVERAFEALVEVSARLVRDGREPRAAAVKVALQRHFGDFSEGKLGFPNFRSFLKGAEDAGRIQLRPAPVGPDVDVVPIGVDLPHPPHPANRLRRDVWDAFTRWDEGFVRFWSRDHGRAYRIPDRSTSTEDAEQARLRQEFVAGTDRLVAIPHIPVEVLVGWAREFANNLPPDPTRTALLAALEQELPVHNFTQLVRRLGLGPRWHDVHVAHVRQLVEKWASENDIQVDFTRDVDAQPTDRRGEAARLARTLDAGTSERELRRRVHEFVDEMTLPELLGLSIPLRLVIDQR
jgi:hypothetical protein